MAQILLIYSVDASRRVQILRVASASLFVIMKSSWPFVRSSKIYTPSQPSRHGVAVTFSIYKYKVAPGMDKV